MIREWNNRLVKWLRQEAITPKQQKAPFQSKIMRQQNRCQQNICTRIIVTAFMQRNK